MVYFGGKKRCPPKNTIDHRCTVGVVYLTSCSNIFNINIYRHILFKIIVQVSIHLSMYLCLSIRPSIYHPQKRRLIRVVSSSIQSDRPRKGTWYYTISYIHMWVVYLQSGWGQKIQFVKTQWKNNQYINNTHTSQALRHFLSGVERWHDCKRTAREAKPMPRWTSRSPRRGAISSLYSPWICKNSGYCRIPRIPTKN